MIGIKDVAISGVMPVLKNGWKDRMEEEAHHPLSQVRSSLLALAITLGCVFRFTYI